MDKRILKEITKRWIKGIIMANESQISFMDSILTDEEIDIKAKELAMAKAASSNGKVRRETSPVIVEEPALVAAGATVVEEAAPVVDSTAVDSTATTDSAAVATDSTAAAK